MFVCAISPARDLSSTYHAWGHSSIVDPWGEVIGTTDETPSIVASEINLEKNEEIRNQIPVIKQRRIKSSLKMES